MAKSSKIVKNSLETNGEVNDYKAQVRKFFDSINKSSEPGEKATILGETDSSIPFFISTSSTILDTIITNDLGGGIPVGRITEIYGAPSSGKSLLASHIIANTQKMGGLAVFIDTEAATSTEFMRTIGVDIDTLVHYRNLDTVEQIFGKIEEIIAQASDFKFVTIVWDSVTAASNDEEMEGEFAAAGYGMAKAKLMSKGFRKIARLLQKHNVALVCTAQTRTNVGISFGEKNVSAAAGKALEFYASLRLKVERNGWLKEKIKMGDKDVEETRGVNVKVSTKKSRVGPGYRECNFNVYFNRGIDDKDSWFDALVLRGGIERPTTQKYKISFEDGREFEFKKTEWKRIIKENNLIDDVKKKLIDSYIMKWEKKEEYTEDDLDAMTPTEVSMVAENE